MIDLFDINLLSQITCLDKKFSISKEQQGLKRKPVEMEHFKDRREHLFKQKKIERKHENAISKDNKEENHLDITV